MSSNVTDEQKNIIQDSNSCFVNAMAGSGKTTTLVEKIQLLLKNENSWKKIAYITFAKKAAKEGKEKLKHLDNGNFIGTYDSFLLNEILPFAKCYLEFEGNDY